MKSNNITQFIVIYLFFLLSLIIGYFINEDFAGGARPDYELHKLAAKYFIDDFKFALLNYDKLGNLHSPIFIIIVSFFIETNEQYGRILYLLISFDNKKNTLGFGILNFNSFIYFPMIL